MYAELADRQLQRILMSHPQSHRASFRGVILIAGLLLGGSTLGHKLWSSATRPQSLEASNPNSPPDRVQYRWVGFCRMHP